MSKAHLHVLFDLDHTLWDFEKNSAEMLSELFEKYNLQKELNIEVSDFISKYREINQLMWTKYNKGTLTKEEMRISRFDLLLRKFGLRDPDLALLMNDEYIEECPKKGYVINGTEEVLSHLHGNYCIHIISNGFEETTRKKLDHSPIGQYIDHYITSESAKSTKPNSEIFLALLKKISGRNSDCIMIGDNYNTDIMGAKRMNMDHIFYNPSNWQHTYKVQYEISQLIEINDIL